MPPFMGFQLVFKDQYWPTTSRMIYFSLHLHLHLSSFSTRLSMLQSWVQSLVRSFPWLGFVPFHLQSLNSLSYQGHLPANINFPWTCTLMVSWISFAELGTVKNLLLFVWFLNYFLCLPLGYKLCEEQDWSYFYYILYFLSLVKCPGHSSVQSLSQVELCDPMDFSVPGLPVHHQLLELTQTHVHQVGDAIQPSHPLSSPSPPTFNLSQHQILFKWVSSLHHVAKVSELQLQHQSFQWIFRTDFL